MRPNSQETVDLVTFTKEIVNLIATNGIIAHDDHLTISSKYQVMDLISRQFTFKYPYSEAHSEPS